tara:strand:- start:2387 stop:2800 length:414 start_codon:yes stop_codon:yes gene_type:complete
VESNIKKKRLSKREKNYVDLAKKASYQSDHSHRHGAVLVKGARVINVSHNKIKFNSFASRFRQENGEWATVHAELGSVLNVERKNTEGATVYVVRVNTTDDFRLSKPCSMCEAAMKWVGIKKVIYSTSNGDFKEMKL